MKRILVIGFLCSAALQALSQDEILNGGFEESSIVTIDSTITDTVATHWSNDDFGFGLTSDAYSGQQAVYIWNWYYYAKGRLTNGVSDSFFPTNGGTSINYRPTAMTGYYKYIQGDVIATTDSATAEIHLLKYNSQTGQRDTLGSGFKKLGEISAYTPFTVNISYTSQEMPDTVLVNFYSSENGFCDVSSSGNCLFLYLDDLALTSATGVEQGVELHQELIVYPNPTNDNLFINTTMLDKTGYTIINNLGAIVMASPTKTNGIMELDLSALPVGIYTLRSGNYAAKFVRN